MAKCIQFTNGSCTVSIDSGLLQFEIVSGDDDPIFCDFDDDRLRAVLNYYRTEKVLREKYMDLSLKHDIARFESDTFHEKTTVLVGYQCFHSTNETLSKLAFFSGKLDFNRQQHENIDRDPVLFSKILTRLRHPFSHDQGIDSFAMQSEMLFWGLSNERSTDNGRLVVPSMPVTSLFRPDMPLSSVPEIGFFLRQHPQISVFMNNYLRYLKFQKNMVSIEATKGAGDLVDDTALKFSLNFDKDQNMDMIGSLHLCIETRWPTMNLESFFNSITVEFSQTILSTKDDDTDGSVVNSISFTQSSQMMRILSLLHRDDAGLTCHAVSGSTTKYIMIPMRFFFCGNTCMTFPLFLTTSMTVTIDSAFLCENSGAFPCKLVCNTYALHAEEKGQLASRANEYLVNSYRCLIEDASPGADGRLDITRTFSPDHPFFFRSIHIVAKDKSTGEVVPCTLHGTVAVGKDAQYAINPFQNQIEQKGHFRLNYRYDARIWFVTESVGEVTSISPSGHRTFAEDSNFQISLKVSDCANVSLSIWLSLFDCICVDETHLSVFECPKLSDLENMNRDAQNYTSTQRYSS